MNVLFSPWHWFVKYLAIYPYPELFGKSDEKCIPDDQLPHHKTWTCIITIDKRSTFHKAIGRMWHCFFCGISRINLSLNQLEDLHTLLNPDASGVQLQEWVGEDLGVHTNPLHQTFLHLGKFNKNNSLHFTSWQNFMLQEKIPAPCAWLLCLALLFVLVLSLSHEKGCLHEWIYNRYKVFLYLGKLCAYWCNIAMRNSN
jgi:hypothetical protein